MKRRFAWLAAACALALLSGCIDTNTKVTVKPDGSGTIERTVILSHKLAALMANMGQKDDPAKTEAGMLNEKGLRDEAGRMGSGVTFVSAKKISTAKGNGFDVLYTFKDIGKLKLSENPAAGLTMPSAGNANAQNDATENLTFAFASGSPATLTVITPKPPAQTNRPQQQPPSGENADKMMAQMRDLYSDMHVVMTIDVQGAITSTNAQYAGGSTVILIDMDFGKILADDATFKSLTSSQSKSLAEVQKLVKTVPGVKVETQEKVTIAFK